MANVSVTANFALNTFTLTLHGWDGWHPDRVTPQTVDLR